MAVIIARPHPVQSALSARMNRSMTTPASRRACAWSSAQGVIQLPGQRQDVTVPLGDVGTYPAAAIANAFAFEHFLHIRYDLLAPGGPLSGDAPSDDLRLTPTLDWIEAALPQQNADLLARMGNAVEINLDGSHGVRGRTLRIGDADLADIAARVSSDPEAFVQWVTQRGTWEALGVQAEGDRSTLEIVRQFRVF